MWEFLTTLKDVKLIKRKSKLLNGFKKWHRRGENIDTDIMNRYFSLIRIDIRLSKQELIRLVLLYGYNVLYCHCRCEKQDLKTVQLLLFCTLGQRNNTSMPPFLHRSSLKVISYADNYLKEKTGSCIIINFMWCTYT